jgi:hypothetical protein
MAVAFVTQPTANDWPYQPHRRVLRPLHPPQSLWDWPERGCGKAQPQRARNNYAPLFTMALGFIHLLRLVLRTQSRSVAVSDGLEIAFRAGLIYFAGHEP